MSLFSTLRARLLLSYLFVVIFSLLAASLALAYLLQGYRDQITVTRLVDVAVPVSVQVRTWLRQGESPEAIIDHLREQAEPTSLRVLLLNRQGFVLQDTATDGSLAGFQVDLPRGMTIELLRPQGGRLVLASRRPLLYAIAPVATILPLLDRGAVAYLVLLQPEDFGPTITELVPRLLAAGVVAFLAAALVALMVSNSLYRPISRLREAAEGMSRGEYAQHVPLAGPRELADLARSFNHMAAEIQRSRQVLRDFVADVSHELKTPLTTIRGFVQAMSDGTAADELARRKALAIVDQEARRLQGLVAQLLDLSRIESGQVAMARQPLNLAEVAQYCLETFALRAKEQGVALRADIAEHVTVLGDADRLEQLLSNLLDNAIRHTPHGGEVVIAAGASEGSVVVTVADSGEGIPQADLARIFERFYTAHGDGGGTGLGLAIARGIARAHGGDIVAASPPQGGTVFTITLPAAGQPTPPQRDRATVAAGARAAPG